MLRIISALILVGLLFQKTYALEKTSNHSNKHILVISLDGMHFQDLDWWTLSYPNSTLAYLKDSGVYYTNATTTKPSDSIPATVAIFTGASPATAGMYYDDAWHRKWTKDKYGLPGVVIDLKEGIDISPETMDGGLGVDSNKLPLDPEKEYNPVYPHQMLRVNTVFEVIRSAGMHTAYSEKRPAYEFLQGPSGKGIIDLYTPEMAFANPKPNDTLKNVDKTIFFDQLRVNSIINQIEGFNHDRTCLAPIPAIFGMNFQVINSAKKSNPSCGYRDLIGTPDSILIKALTFIDNSLALVIAHLKKQNLLEKTVFIITAKHGESPLGNQRKIVLTSLIGEILNTVHIKTKKITQKTSALIWLADQSQTPLAIKTLKDSSILTKDLKEILFFGSSDFEFPDPLKDPAVPDIIVVMKDGVNFEPCYDSKTYAEHGGFGKNETHVPLLITNVNWKSSIVHQPVLTKQIAPTILSLLNLDPQALMGVQIEKTTILPGIPITFE